MWVIAVAGWPWLPALPPAPSTQHPAQHSVLSQCPANTVKGQLSAPVSVAPRDPLAGSGFSCPVDGRGLRAPGVLAPSACGWAWGKGWAGGLEDFLGP